MSWKFTIINNRTDARTIIEEDLMVGWDKLKNEIKRDLIWHGVFFGSQGADFEFWAQAEKVLKAEYEAYGIEADMSLKIEQDCGHGYEFYDTWKFVFTNYDHSSGQGCFVKCTLEATDDVMTIRNRVDQKVNLEAGKSFDEVTVLPAYSRLPFSLLLPSKGIFIQDYFKNDNDFETPVQGVPENDNPGADPSSTNNEDGMIEVGFDNQAASEIGLAGTGNQALYNCVLTYAGFLGCNDTNRFILPGLLANNISPLSISPTVNFQENTPNYGAIDNPCKLEVLILGSFFDIDCTIDNSVYVIAILPVGKEGTSASDYTFIQLPIGGALPGGTIAINIGYFDDNFILNKGDRIYQFISIHHTRVNSDITSGIPAFKMKFDSGNYFRLSNISHTPATTSKAFMINEAISRVVEAVTDNKVKGYSEYFGRTDSEPYSHDNDGCGSMEAITDGLRIRRQENKIPGKSTPFSVSLKDIFDGICPVHNIGMGLEPDTNRPGFNRWRTEPWHFFYKDQVIMHCTGVEKIKRRVYEKEIYSGFQFGYQKWEAEEYTGLDEFLTKRNSRTRLAQISNNLVKVSTFVYSGYALEITRRKGNNNSKDWRYDKDVFGICLTRNRKYHVVFSEDLNSMVFETDTDGSEFLGPTTITIAGSVSNNGTRSILSVAITSIPDQATSVEIVFSGGATVTEEAYGVTFTGVTSPAGIFVELGNAINTANIIEPETLYNFRRSPVRNAMRWLNKVAESYRTFDNTAKLIFTDGDGNCFAEGELESLLCKIENQVLPENISINVDLYSDSEEAKPFMLPERVTYDYPMDACDYRNVKTNPYGLIYFDDGCERGYGFIDSIIHRPDEGMATFNLIPAITDLPVPAATLYESGLRMNREVNDGLTTEDNKYLVTE
jgi:hypothetical protein